MTYNDIITKLKNKEPFQFARVGDGEMLCMDGVSGKNCDGHKYFVDLGKALREVYKEPKNYHIGLQPVKHGLHSSAKKYPQKWCNADLLHNASINGEISELYEVLENRNVIMIGNKTHKNLPFINIFLEVPSVNAWQYRLAIWKALNDIAVKGKDFVYLFSCGMMSGVLIDEMANLYPNHTCIDTGSIFEPYLGKAIRSYHKKILERENSKHSDVQTP